MKRLLPWVAITIVALIWNVTAFAGSSQSDGAAQFEPQAIASFAKKVERAAAKRGARVFLLSRVGRPSAELPPGLEYTHVGFGVYSQITTDDGRTVPGYAMYNLYQRADQPDRSHIVVDFPADFFGAVYELKAAILIPKPELQRRLLKVIGSNTHKDLHNPRYSAISNPFNTKLQNCTEYLLDVIQAAIYETDDVAQIKKNSQTYFEPQEIHVNPFKLLLGTLFMPDISVSDHDGEIATATFTTVAKYLEKYGMVDEQFTLVATGEPGI